MNKIIEQASSKLQPVLNLLHAKRTYGVWVPTRAADADIVLTDEKTCRIWSLKVRSSRNYLIGTERRKDHKYVPPQIQDFTVIVSTWFSFSHDELADAKVDYLALVLGTQHDARHCMVIKPSHLLHSLQATHGVRDEYQMYIAVSDNHQIIDWRELHGEISMSMAFGTRRDYTQFYNEWP